MFTPVPDGIAAVIAPRILTIIAACVTARIATIFPPVLPYVPTRLAALLAGVVLTRLHPGVPRPLLGRRALARRLAVLPRFAALLLTRLATLLADLRTIAPVAACLAALGATFFARGLPGKLGVGLKIGRNPVGRCRSDGGVGRQAGRGEREAERSQPAISKKICWIIHGASGSLHGDGPFAPHPPGGPFVRMYYMPDTA